MSDLDSLLANPEGHFNAARRQIEREQHADAMRKGDHTKAFTAALALIKAHGYVVLREKSYRQAQERQRAADARAKWEAEAAEHARQWAAEAFAEQRRLADRLTHVYGVARAHGATIEELQQP